MSKRLWISGVGAYWVSAPFVRQVLFAAVMVGRWRVSFRGKDKMSFQQAKERGMGKGLIASVMLHTIVIALVIVYSGGSVKKHPETITVFLADVAPQGERGAAGSAPARVGMKLSSHPPAKQGPSLRRENWESAVPRTTKPSAPDADNEASTNKVAAAESPALSTFSAGPLVASASPGARGATEGRGSGDRTGAGVTGAGKGGAGTDYGTGDGADGGKKQYLEHNFGYIRDLIVKNLKYPYAARRMGWKGSVTIAFVILENGTAEAVRVIQSSGYDLLDQSVLKTVRALQPFPSPPVRAELVIPIAFRLE